MSPADRQRLGELVAELATTVEQLLLTGTTTVSRTTLAQLEVGVREAGRHRLLRLASALRILHQELGYFLADDERFSRRRLVFFINRVWLLCRGTGQALAGDERPALAGLLTGGSEAGRTLARLEVVTLGVAKKVVPNLFCALDFRLRVIDCPGGELAPGHPLVWSCVFPLKAGRRISPEAFLHFDQPQKFRPVQWLEGRIRLEDVTLGGDGRLTLTRDSRVAPAGAFEGWPTLAHWDRGAARERLRAYRPSPLDLEVELQEEAVLTHWQVGTEVSGLLGERRCRTLSGDGLELIAVADPGEGGDDLWQTLAGLQPADCSPLYGLLHYEACRLVLQPLSLLRPEGPRHLTLGRGGVDAVSYQELLKQL